LVIVVPERERPGITAMHWQRPMISASRMRMLFSDFAPALELIGDVEMQPVSRNMISYKKVL
jgi:hypothetical protein